LQGFDCVTLVETALALAWADDREAFLTLLRQVRYRHGKIAWQQRLHYATDWLHHHVQHGRLREVACGEAMQRITRRLDVRPGFPPPYRHLAVLPHRGPAGCQPACGRRGHHLLCLDASGTGCLSPRYALSRHTRRPTPSCGAQPWAGG